MRRYSYNRLTSSISFLDNDLAVAPAIEYDDIVDRSHFTLDSESIRDSVLQGSFNSSSSLKYDDDSVTLSDFELALRQGKLDKAEVYQYQLKLQDKIKSSVDKDAKDLAQSKLDKINAARQDYLDKVTGFDSQSVDLKK